MEAQFRNLRTVEALKAEWETEGINIKACRRCEYNKITGEKIPGKYIYLKHKSGTQKYFGTDDASKHYCTVAEALAKDIESNGQPDPNKVVMVQDVSQDGGETWATQIQYQGGNQDNAFRF